LCLLIAAGVHPKAIQARLGHASITTTLNVYGHLMPDAFSGVGAQLDALVQGTGEAQERDNARKPLQDKPERDKSPYPLSRSVRRVAFSTAYPASSLLK
jgi:hypothetical protein